MIIEYTQQEKETIEEIKERYNRLLKPLDDTQDLNLDELTEAQERRVILYSECHKELSAFRESCEAKRFKEISDSPDAILKNAEEQIPTLIEAIYKEQILGFTPEIVQDLNSKHEELQRALENTRKFRYAKDPLPTNIGLVTDGKQIFVCANRMFYFIIDELNLHLEALKGDKVRLAQLFDLIIKSVESSSFTNEEKIDFNLEKATYTKKTYRTKGKAEEIGAITKAPKNLIIPTYKGYQYSMSLYQSGGAHLQPITGMDNLQFTDGKLYFKGTGIKEVGEAELRDLRTKEGIQELDLTTLRFYYTLLYDKFQNSGFKVQDTITVSASLLTGRNDPKEADIKAAIEKVKSYHNVLGVIKGKTPTGKPAESYFPVLNFEGYDSEYNTISFSSPYMNYVIDRVFKLAIKKDKEGNPKLKKSGKPIRLPTQSYLIDSSIVKERNKAATENVNILVALIEQAGKATPRIKAVTLIERNVQFAERINNDPAHCSQLLNRVFTKTWELLKTKTMLTKCYKNLCVSIDKDGAGIPLEKLNPKDPAFIPTVRSLEDLCFYFPNEGKQKKPIIKRQ